MSFIQKYDPIVLSVKLTSIGRDQLAKGKLNFNSFAVGDSEIDYNFINENNFTPSNFNILLPLDEQPKLLSFIPANYSGTPYNYINQTGSIATNIQNTAKTCGFFTISGDNYTLITDSNNVKQSDIMLNISESTGNTYLKLYQSPNYENNLLEPNVNDYLLIKWTNPNNINTTGNTFSLLNPLPFLFYKIEEIVSGSIANNNLIIKLDRNLPNFSGYTGSTYAGGIIFYNSFSGDSYYQNDYINGDVFSFFENNEPLNFDFPYWKLSIVFTDEISGVQLNDKKYSTFNSNGYGGFVSYIQNQNPIIKKLGIIHYTNSSPANSYGEGLYLKTPKLFIPTIMWHLNTDNKMGIVLSAYGDEKMLTGTTKSLNIDYYDLSDQFGNIVGKVFNGLKLFIIEDQELLFALSYKSNRNWTLPKSNLAFNSNITFGCIACNLTADIFATNPTEFGSNGSITIENLVSSDQYSSLPIFIEVRNSDTLALITLSKYEEPTTLSNIPVGDYTVTIYDTNAPNCYISTEVSIVLPDIIQIYNISFVDV